LNSNYRGLASATFALAVVILQFGFLRLSTSEIAVRIVLPATILAVPAALWVYRDRVGVWVIYVGLLANLAPILANGGLMPIRHASIVEAVGEERAARYETGSWIPGSKDVLVPNDGGRLTGLGDQIVIRVGGGGLIVSPGDLVIWAGLLVLAGEASLAWQRRQRAVRSPTSARAAAEGGAVTQA
jgi:hypothetical protein